MIHRRRVLKAAALSPVLSFVPWLSGSALAAAPADGLPVGPGTLLDADRLAGFSLSWLDPEHQPHITVQALVKGNWGGHLRVESDRGHGRADPEGRDHGAPILVPGATAYWIMAEELDADLRYHPIEAADRSLALLAGGLSKVEPVPGLKIIERHNWTDVERLDTIDCILGSSVFGLGCRSDVGTRHALVHHTVSINTYSKSEVPELLRGIQTYHMATRGWDDIAYNFVVDRFGRIWHAREGQIDEPITGGHTTGLNAESVGVAVLGNFTNFAPPQEVIDSIGRLLGWKLSIHGVDPLGHTLVRAGAGDFAEPGEMVDVANIAGHRDHQITACPGQLLYPLIAEIRAAAAELVPVFGHLDPRYTLDDVTLEGWAIDRFDPESAVTVDIEIDGEPHASLSADRAVDDLDADYPDAGAAHGFDHAVPIDLDTASIVVTARAGDGRTAKLMDLTLFATFIDVEPDRFFAAGVYFLRRKGLTQGTLPGLFEPMDEVTRAQMATFLHRFMDLPVAKEPAPFDDLDVDSFYSEAVDWLYEQGITTGTGPGEFSPDVFVTRGQMATFLWRLCGEIAPTAAAPFDDVAAGAFYADAVAWMLEIEITTGLTPKIFGPDDLVTRGEMATFLHRLATTAVAWTAVDPPSSVEL